MINFFRLITLLLLLISFNTSAQRHRLYNTPTKLLFDSKIYSVYYEYAISRKLSVQLGLETGTYVEHINWYPTDSGRLNKNEYRVKGYGISPELKYYPFNKVKSARGLFAGIYYRYRSINENEFDYTDHNMKKGTVEDYGVSLGYKLIWGICIIEPLVGYGSSSTEWENKNKYYPINEEIKHLSTNSYNQFGDLRYELNVGFTFGKGS